MCVYVYTHANIYGSSLNNAEFRGTDLLCSIKLLTPSKLKLSLSIRGRLKPGPPQTPKSKDAQVCDIKWCRTMRTVSLPHHELPTSD